MPDTLTASDLKAAAKRAAVARMTTQAELNRQALLLYLETRGDTACQQRVNAFYHLLDSVQPRRVWDMEVADPARALASISAGVDIYNGVHAELATTQRLNWMLESQAVFKTVIMFEACVPTTYEPKLGQFDFAIADLNVEGTTERWLNDTLLKLSTQASFGVEPGGLYLLRIPEGIAIQDTISRVLPFGFQPEGELTLFGTNGVGVYIICRRCGR